MSFRPPEFVEGFLSEQGEKVQGIRVLAGLRLADGGQCGLRSAIEAEFSADGTSIARMQLLVLLMRSEGQREAPSRLAERAGVSTATVTGVVDTLARQGFVTREAHPEDRRRMDVVLTDAGSDVPQVDRAAAGAAGAGAAGEAGRRRGAGAARYPRPRGGGDRRPAIRDTARRGPEGGLSRCAQSLASCAVLAGLGDGPDGLGDTADSVDDAVTRALARHPALTAAERAGEAAHARTRQAKTAWLPRRERRRGLPLPGAGGRAGHRHGPDAARGVGAAERSRGRSGPRTSRR
jgi:DNA-binding MarR family transcriptional regulator